MTPGWRGRRAGGGTGGNHGEENEDCHAWLKLGDESRGWFTLLWQNELNPGWAELRCAMPGLFLNFYTPQQWQGDRQWGAEQITSVSQGKKYGVPERKAKISIQASQLFRRVVFGWSAKSRFGSRSGVVSGKNSTAGFSKTLEDKWVILKATVLRFKFCDRKQLFYQRLKKRSVLLMGSLKFVFV